MTIGMMGLGILSVRKYGGEDGKESRSLPHTKGGEGYTSYNRAPGQDEHAKIGQAGQSENT